MWGCITQVVLKTADLVTVSLASLILKENLTEMLPGGFARVYTTTTYILFAAAIFLLLLYKPRQQILLSKWSTFCIPLLIIIGTLSSGIMNILVISYSANRTPDHIFLIMSLLSCVFLLCFAAMVILIYHMGKLYQRNLELREEKARYQLDAKQLELLSEATTTLRKWKHDYQNTLDTMGILLAENRIENLKSYFSEAVNAIPGKLFLITSGNTVADAILSAKLQSCKSQGIPFRHTIYLSGTLSVSDLDFSAILGNLLDNAIESCQKATVLSNTLIDCSITRDKGMLKIIISNWSDGIYRRDQKTGQLLSTKPVGEHGFGLEHVFDIVKRCGGFYSITADSNKFEISILLPCRDS